MRKNLLLITLLLGMLSAVAQKRAVFITAGQSNADGREYVANLPQYLKSGQYHHLRFANVTDSAPSAFADRDLLGGKRYAFQDVCNYWIDQVSKQDFYAVKCTYGGTAIALGQTAPKVPVWNASTQYVDTARAYRGQIAGGEGAWPFVEGNSLAKSFASGFSALADGELSRLADGYEVKAIMWHQGESDRKAAEQYYENLKTLIAYMRRAIYEKSGDAKALRTPFIMGTVCRKSTQYNAKVEEAQRRIANEDADVYLIDMSRASLRSDNLHFDSLSTEYLGKAMYNVLVKIGAVEGDTVATGLPYRETPSQWAGDDFSAARVWDFTKPWSEASVEALKADADHWCARSGWGYRYTDAMRQSAELHTAAGYVFPETQGLYFSGVGNRACIDPGKNIGLYGGNFTLTIPQVKPGQYVIIESVTARQGTARGIVPDEASRSSLDSIQGGYASTERMINVWWIQDTFESPVDASFQATAGLYIYRICVADAMPATGVRPLGAGIGGDEGRWYTLSGMLVDAPEAGGVYIHRGRKVLLR